MDFPSALSGLGTALSLARNAVDARDDAKLRAALHDMYDRLLSAQTAALALSHEVEQLRTQLRKLEQEGQERERYVLQEVTPGRFALRYKPATDDPTPVHHLCQTCHGAGQKVVLRYIKNGLMGTSLDCPIESQHDVYFPGTPPDYEDLCRR